MSNVAKLFRKISDTLFPAMPLISGEEIVNDSLYARYVTPNFVTVRKENSKTIEIVKFPLGERDIDLE